MIRNRRKKSTIGMITKKKAITPTNIIAEFRKTGIFSLSEHIFNECDFLPSLVTNQPNTVMHQQASDIWKKTKAFTMLIFSCKI